MNPYVLIFIAARNLARQRRRYALVAATIIFGFALITLLSSAANGALEAVKAKAARYFSGHVTVIGLQPGGRVLLNDADSVTTVIADADLPIRIIAKRSSYYAGDAALFFGGETVRQRKLIGVDFSVEGPEFSGFRYVSGGWEALANNPNGNGILISEAAAKVLKCRIGDDVTLFLRTDSGQYNASVLIVRGIFSETSLFGYAAYCRSDTLNLLTARAPGTATDIALYSEDGTDVDKLAEAVRMQLAERFPTLPSFTSREERDLYIQTGITEPCLGVLSLNAQLAQITQLLDALRYLTNFILIIFVCIIMAGILNTYRVIVHERTQEIGSLRALGMGRDSTSILFLAEATLLAAFGLIAGLALGILLLRLLTGVDFSNFPAAGLILERGRLRFSLNALTTAVNGAVMICAALAAAFGPARKAAAISPAAAMRTTV